MMHQREKIAAAVSALESIEDPNLRAALRTLLEAIRPLFSLLGEDEREPPEVLPPGSVARLWSERANRYVALDASGWRRRRDASGQEWLYEGGAAPQPYVMLQDVVWPADR